MDDDRCHKNIHLQRIKTDSLRITCILVITVTNVAEVTTNKQYTNGNTGPIGSLYFTSIAITICA